MRTIKTDPLCGLFLQLGMLRRLILPAKTLTGIVQIECTGLRRDEMIFASFQAAFVTAVRNGVIPRGARADKYFEAAQGFGGRVVAKAVIRRCVPLGETEPPRGTVDAMLQDWRRPSGYVAELTQVYPIEQPFVRPGAGDRTIGLADGRDREAG